MTRRRPSTVDCDVSSLAPALGAVDVLARLRLAGRRLELEIRLQRPSAELLELIDFVGLLDALGVEVERQPEQREQRLGVEEERELDDPAA